MADCFASARRNAPAPGLNLLSFRSVNRRGAPDHDPGLQRHHLLPRQLLTARGFGRFFAALDPRLIGFDDFRRNGLLLPANDDAARRLGLPLHRGPHRAYNAMVMERVGAIESDWSRQARPLGWPARHDALQRLALLQRALRRGLLGGYVAGGRGHTFALNRMDPALRAADFAELDAMADRLWGGAMTLDAAGPG